MEATGGMSQEACFAVRLMSFSTAFSMIGAAWHISQTLDSANEAGVGAV